MTDIKREWRVTRESGVYRLRQVDHTEGEPPTVARNQPGGFQQSAEGKDLPGLYESLLKGARREIEQAFDREVIEL